MSDRWGSHWRWRAAMASVLLVLLACMYLLAEQWLMRRLVPSRSMPAVIRVTDRSREWLETFDWKAGKRRKIANLPAKIHHRETSESLRVVQNGKAVAWQEGGELHVVDILPPHEERVFGVAVDLRRYKFIGVSADGNFAAYQGEADLQTNSDGTTVVVYPPGGGANRPIRQLAIVDLQTGEVCDTRQWESNMWASGQGGEFSSSRLATPSPPLDPTEPRYGQWTITEQGTWGQISSTETRVRANYAVFATKDENGNWQYVDDASTSGQGGNVQQLDIDESSPSGKRVLVNESVEPSIWMVDRESKTIRPFPAYGQRYVDAAFVDDETIVFGDLRDDIRVIDAKSGKLIAIESSGSQRRIRLAVVGSAWLLAAATWLVLAFRERNLFWGIADSLAVVLAFQYGLAALLIASNPAVLGYGPNLIQWQSFVIYFFVGASNVGAATIVGWYWAHGRGWLLARWGQGAVWLCLSAVPSIVVAAFFFGDTGVASLLALIGFNILLAGLTAFVVAGFWLFGWTIHDAPLYGTSRRFGLATFFAVVSGIAVLIAVGKQFFGDVANSQMILPSLMGATAAAAGIVLVASLLSRARWYILWTICALLIGFAAWGVFYVARISLFGFPTWIVYAFLWSAIAGIVFAMILPCLVLRSHGWHWVRLSKQAVASAPTKDVMGHLAESRS